VVNDRVALADLPGHTIFDGGRLNKDWVLTWGPLVKTFLKTFAPPLLDNLDLPNETPNPSLSLGDLDLVAPWVDVVPAPATPAAAAAARAAAGPPGATAPAVVKGLLPVLHGVLFLCDIRWPVAPEDCELLRLCREELNLPVLLVFTKDDLVRHVYIRWRCMFTILGFEGVRMGQRAVKPFCLHARVINRFIHLCMGLCMCAFFCARNHTPRSGKRRTRIKRRGRGSATTSS
jgi:hypothetical protein